MGNSPDINPDVWVDEYGDALFGFALARVKDKGIAEDIVQETFLAAVRGKERFKGRSSVKTWLFGILKHKIIDHFRKNISTLRTRDINHDPDNLEAFFNARGGWQIRPQNWRSDPGKSQENKEFLDHFYRCMADLPQRTADVFAFREIDGLSTREICQKLGISKSNYWVILYRARMLLRRCLEMVGFGNHS